VAEHAYMQLDHDGPHGTANGLLGLGALINVLRHTAGQLHRLRISSASDPMVERHSPGLPRPGRERLDGRSACGPGPLGLDIDADGAKKYLREEDAGFFD